MEKVALTIVVPCFNEEAALPHLRDKLQAARLLWKEKYDVHLILVDDGSRDDTWNVMQRLFQSEPNCTLLRQPANLGIGASILNGIRRAKTEVVCSIDSDCTYDPQQLERLMPMLTADVALVSASPYHPAGRVLDVPGWRLFLSQAASALYRFVLRQKLHTYTSCFRVYRRSAVLKLKLRRNGFLGVAELIAKLDLHGFVIVECPTTLTGRTHGTSKMKVARVLVGHLGLLCELLALRGRQMLLGRPCIG